MNLVGGLSRRARGQTRYLILDLKLSLLEAADRIVVGIGSGILLNNRLLKGSVLGPERLDVVHCAHTDDLRALLRTKNCDSGQRPSHVESDGSQFCA